MPSQSMYISHMGYDFHMDAAVRPAAGWADTSKAIRLIIRYTGTQSRCTIVLAAGCSTDGLSELCRCNSAHNPAWIVVISSTTGMDARWHFGRLQGLALGHRSAE
jgi:hypothetical protein